MKATVAYDADWLPVSTNTPVQIVMSAKTSQMSPMDHRRRGLRPSRPGRKAKASAQAKLNIWLVAVIRVVSTSAVIPADLSMLLR